MSMQKKISTFPQKTIRYVRYRAYVNLCAVLTHFFYDILCINFLAFMALFVFYKHMWSFSFPCLVHNGHIFAVTFVLLKTLGSITIQLRRLNYVEVAEKHDLNIRIKFSIFLTLIYYSMHKCSRTSILFIFLYFALSVLYIVVEQDTNDGTFIHKHMI